jgi:hypothetical protein
MSKFTKKEVLAMSIEQLRLEIAKAKGWTDINTDHWFADRPTEIANCYVCEDVPNWPTDIAAAWELVKDGKYPCGIISIARPLDSEKKFEGGWRIWYRTESGFLSEFIDTDTAARGICCAWLICNP